MAQAFTALANAGQCGPNAGLKKWTCEACRAVGFDVIPDSVNVITGREMFQGQSTSVYVAKVKGSFPGSVPRPAEDVKHAGEDCWAHCRQVEGYCDWCGVGNICATVTGVSDAIQHRCAKPADDTTEADGSSEDAFGCAVSFRGSH